MGIKDIFKNFKMPKKEKKEKPLKASPKKQRFKEVLKYLTILAIVLGVAGFFKANSINTPSEAQVKPQVIEKEEDNPAASVGAQTFAKNFVEDYYSWSTDDLNERSEKLAEYLRPGLDENAGIRYDGLTADSSIKEVEIIGITDNGKNQATITFHVSHYLKKKKEDDEDAKKTGPFHKYIEVPVLYEKGGYVVDSIPTFTHEPIQPKLAEKQPDKRSTSNDINRNSVEEFLSTFLKVYASGTAQELEYYTDDLNLHPLSNNMTFKEVETFQAYDAEKGSFDLNVRAIYQDEETKGTILQTYEMNIIKQDNRWIIKSLK